MELKKVRFEREGNKLNLVVPFQKIDQENRKVIGFATIDNVDRHGEVVTAEASLKAFTEFTGGLREMHQPIAVGKVVSFQQEDIYDEATDKFYNGIVVETYVSKGAQDTWEKVLDGTLKGFSIGGEINKHVDQYNADDDKMIRYFTDYSLHELSLVDNPANQLCNILAVQKNADGKMFAKGMIADTKIENVFWCQQDRAAISKSADVAICAACGQNMHNIGWVEDDSSSKTQKVRETIATFLKSAEGGTDMAAEETTKVEKDVVTSDQVNGGGEENHEGDGVLDEPIVNGEPAEQGDENEKEDEAKPEDSSEVDDDEPDFNKFAKSLSDITKTLTALDERDKARDAKFTELNEAVDAVSKSVDTQVKDLLAKHDELAKEFSEYKSEQQAAATETAKRIDTLDSNTAVKKSADATADSGPETKRSVWSGAFLPKTD